MSRCERRVDNTFLLHPALSLTEKKASLPQWYSINHGCLRNLAFLPKNNIRIFPLRSNEAWQTDAYPTDLFVADRFWVFQNWITRRSITRENEYFAQRREILIVLLFIINNSLGRTRLWSRLTHRSESVRVILVFIVVLCFIFSIRIEYRQANTAPPMEIRISCRCRPCLN